MKLQYIGVKRMAGKSKKDQSPYDFSNLLYARPIKPASRENLQILGHGAEQSEIAIDPLALDQFAACKVGQIVDVRVEPMPENPQRNWVVGLQS